jgi:hypothetical protein
MGSECWNSKQEADPECRFSSPCRTLRPRNCLTFLDLKTHGLDFYHAVGHSSR